MLSFSNIKNKSHVYFIHSYEFMTKEKDCVIATTSYGNSIIASIKKENISVELFFDINSYNLIGWQTEDMYQNKVNTSLFDLKKNQNIDKKLFRLPTIN